MTRAMFEGIRQQIGLVRDSLVAASAPVTTVRATGGALRSTLWAQVVAAGSGYGAALLGWHALGGLPSLTGAAWSRPHRTVTPDPAAVRRMAATRHLSERAYRLLSDLAL